ncbi:flavin reductase family protein [Nocardia sp. NPDC058499]|uniref:flavin reductase family protein n=1 Tax=Nocardia sp. NPDC058499 TaxID=3346530 RepID=UPI0036512914
MPANCPTSSAACSSTGDPAPGRLRDSPVNSPQLGRYGVAAPTTHSGDPRCGMAANSFPAVSLDPPLVLWSLREESRSTAAFLADGRFGTNILADHQIELSAQSGRSRNNSIRSPGPSRDSAARWTQRSPVPRTRAVSRRVVSSSA